METLNLFIQERNGEKIAAPFPVKKVYEDPSGLTMMLHRPPDYRRHQDTGEVRASLMHNAGWTISEYTTGLIVVHRSPTMAEAMQKAQEIIKTNLERAEWTEEPTKVLQGHKVINKSKN